MAEPPPKDVDSDAPDGDEAAESAEEREAEAEAAAEDGDAGDPRGDEGDADEGDEGDADEGDEGDADDDVSHAGGGDDSDDDEEDDIADLPGSGDIDPELLKLSKPRTRVGWLLSLSVVVFCVFWMVRLRSDLAFSRQSDEPVAVEAGELSGVESDRYVSVRSRPDRARVARVHYGADFGSHVAPVLGSDGALWLLTPASAFSPATRPAEGERYEGRVKRLGEMPFFAQLQEFFSQRPVFEPLEPTAAIAALTSGAATIKTAYSDTLRLEPKVAVEVVRRTRGKARIVATANPRGRNDELSWRNALQQAGVLGLGDQPITDSPRSWTYEIAAPEGLDAIRKKLEDNRLSGAAVIPVEAIYTARWSDLAARGDELAVGDQSMPLAEVTTVAVAHRPPLRADAIVIVATERPADYWYILWLYGLFGAFFLLFGWMLVTAVRGSEPPTPAPAS